MRCKLDEDSGPFEVTTDASNIAIGAVLSQNHQPIAFFSKKLTPRLASSSTYIRELYGLTESGKENVVADALSRAPADDGAAICASITSLSFPLLTQLQQFYCSNTAGQQLLAKFHQDPAMQQKFTFRSGLLHYQDRIFVPKEANLMNALLEEFHSSPLGGHSGIKATLARLSASFFWPGMHSDVKAFVNQCSTCQYSKYDTHSPYGLLQPLPVPSQVWEDISMDFITHLPLSANKTVIWVVVDRLTKFAHFIAIPTGFSAASLAAIFLAEIYRLRCFVSEEPRLWTRFLPLAEFWYNSSFHSAIGMSPFEALYGRPPPSITHYVPGSTKVGALDDLLTQKAQILKRLKENLTRARHRMTQQTNKHRKDKIFEEGQWVYLKLQPYRQISVQQRASQKLAKRFYGPFRILRRVGPVAYELELPATARIHPVFHVSLLKACHGQPTTQVLPLPLATATSPLHSQPLRVLDHRWGATPAGLQEEILVQWEGQNTAEATWELKASIAEAYPTLDLEDKIVLDHGGNDTGQTMENGPQMEIGPFNTASRPKREIKKPARYVQ